jgi:hypothetical protein
VHFTTRTNNSCAIPPPPEGSGFSRTSGELLQLLPSQNTPVVVGWGKDARLLTLVEQCVRALDGRKMVGVGMSKGTHLCNHPSPMLQRMKDEWLSKAKKLLQ